MAATVGRITRFGTKESIGATTRGRLLSMVYARFRAAAYTGPRVCAATRPARSTARLGRALRLSRQALPRAHSQTQAYLDMPALSNQYACAYITRGKEEPDGNG
jgi:hypothetical protein